MIAIIATVSSSRVSREELVTGGRGKHDRDNAELTFRPLK